MIRRRRRSLLVLALLLVAAVILCLLDLCLGGQSYSLGEVASVLLSGKTGGAAFTIREVRLPKVLAAVFAGGAFGLSGAILQRMLNNPLASPDVMGVMSGASAAAVFGMVLMHWSGAVVSLLAVLAGMGVSLLLFGLTGRQGAKNARLILMGIGMQAFLSALVSWMLLLANAYDVGLAMRWMTGSLNHVTLESVVPAGLVIVLLAAVTLLFSGHLKMLQLKDELATGLGARPGRFRLVFLLLSAGLASVAASVTGPIAAVAFLSGPIAARIDGTGDAPLVSAALVGIVLVLGADLLGSAILPVRYPAGVITGLLGAPYLLWLLSGFARRKGHG